MTVLKHSVLISCLAGFQLLAASLTIYLGNTREYTFTLHQLLFVVGAVSIFLTLCTWGVLMCFRKTRHFETVLLASFALTVCLWFQSSFFHWPLAKVSVEIQGISENPFWGILELILYAGIFFVVFRARKMVKEYIPRFVLVIFSTQMLVLFPSLMNYRDTHIGTNIIVENENVFKVSKGGDIHFLIIDSFSEPYFQKTIQNSPEILTNFQDFTHHSRLLSMYPSTIHAVPTLITGNDLFDREMRWNMKKNAYEQVERSLFMDKHNLYQVQLRKIYEDPQGFLNILHRNGYQLEIYDHHLTVHFPQIPDLLNNTRIPDPKIENKKLISYRVISESLIPQALYRLSPLLVKPAVYSATNRALRSLYAMYSAPANEDTEISKTGILAEKNAANIKKEPDPGYLVPADSENFQIPEQPETTERKSFKAIHLIGIHDMDLTLKAQGEEEYTRMGKAYLELAGEYIQYLKKCGTYENSWIVILADHGHHLSPEVAERFHPFMLIKRPGETHEKMQEDGSILLMRDIAPTILEELRLPIPGKCTLRNRTPEDEKEREEHWKYFITDNQTKEGA